MIARILFKDAILSKEFFGMPELVELLFPGLENPEALLSKIM